jgi:hypothetical protein
MQAPYTPTGKLYQNSTWQANDPLVHYTLEDLTDLKRTNNIQFVKPPNISPTNTNLGKLNDRYNPWGGNTNKTASSDPRAYDLAMKDPLIRRSDDGIFRRASLPTSGCWAGFIAARPGKRFISSPRPSRWAIGKSGPAACTPNYRTQPMTACWRTFLPPH